MTNTQIKRTMQVQPLPNGHFDVQDQNGKSVLSEMGGPFRSRQAAESALRMLTAFDQVDQQIGNINDRLRQAKEVQQ